MSNSPPAASAPRRSAADVFRAANNTLKEIDNLVGKLQDDFRSLHEPKVFGGREEEDDVVDSEYIEFLNFAEQVRSAVRQLEKALDRKGGTGSHGNGDEDGPAETNPKEGSAEWFAPASRIMLTIDSLDSQLKQCLLCSAVFEGDQVIKKRLLIHYWIGEGMVDSVTAGKACFANLLSRGLLQPVQLRAHCSRVHHCKIHPQVHQCIVQTAESFDFFGFHGAGEGERDPAEEYPGATRRARLSSKQGGEGTVERASKGELLTLYNLNQRYVKMEKAWLAEQDEMGTLQLGRWRASPKHHIELLSPDILESVSACKNLRYLSLRGMSLVESLPESMGNLCGLVILDLRACHNLEKLPESIGSMQKLEFLDMSECYLLDEMPKSLTSLRQLQVLKGFVVGSATSTRNPCRLADLIGLPKLRKLRISTGRHSQIAPDDALQRLQACGSLQSLTVTWGAVTARKMSEPPSPEATELVLPPSLRKLDLRRVPVENLLHLLHPAKSGGLSKLYIRGGNLQSMGNAEGWTVETLRLRFLKNLDCDWEQLMRSFGKLRLVEMCECPNLRSWRCDSDGLWRLGTDDPATSSGSHMR